MGFDTNVRLLGLFTKNLSFLRNDASRQVSTREATALLPFAGGKAMDCRHLFALETLGLLNPTKKTLVNSIHLVS